MKSSYTPLMQSKYFSVAFNSAIFDGPYRIYFSQFHESFALKIYFLLQQRTGTEFSSLRSHSQKSKVNFYIMIYPHPESFDYSFEEGGVESLWSTEKWNRDLVMGLKRPLEDHEVPQFIDEVARAVFKHAEEIEFEGNSRGLDL